jgi:hypothetical protein
MEVKMTKKGSAGLFLIVFVLFQFTGCGPSVAPNLNPGTITLNYNIPLITALKGYPELQEKQGIIISANPVNFTKETRSTYKCEWVRSRIGEMLNATDSTQDPNVELTYLVSEIPHFQVTPNELIFKLTVHNNLSRVLRLAGTVIAIQVDGKMANIDKANYKEFIDGFVIPRQEAEFKIIGPRLDTLPEKCNIGLFLYDIITSVDAAGTATKKANFEWFFSYENVVKEEPGTINKKILKMTPGRARALEGQR